MKTPLQELMEYMNHSQYPIKNDLLAKYNELIEKEKQEFISRYLRAITTAQLRVMAKMRDSINSH